MSGFDEWAKGMVGINLNDFDRMVFNAGVAAERARCAKICREQDTRSDPETCAEAIEKEPTDRIIIGEEA